jgi:colanic acid biosynthesis glycosyl transferase WcaI
MLVPYYAPDIGPSAPLFTMLSEELVRRGHRVSVIAAVPHYPTGSVPELFRKHWIQRSSENGVEIIRVRIPSVKRASMAQRLLQYICYQLGATWAGIRLRYDAAFVANPALWVWLPFVCLVVLRRKPSIFSVHDVYPDVGVKLGIFRNKWVIAAVAALERYCLNRSSVVRILSESFRPGLHALGLLEDKMVLLYDWVDTDLIQPLPRNNPFARQHNLVERFVVLYAGNLGLSQGLEHVLTVAEHLADHPDLLFVFVGDGAGREKLVAQSEQRRLSNVLFLPFQTRERLPEVLASASVSLVTLKRSLGSGSLPSKTLSGLASGRPLVVSVDENSDTWNLVEKAEAGLCVPPETPPLLADAILTLLKDPNLCERLGRNGRAWAEKNHSLRYAAEQFETLFSTVISANST